jgi:homoserine kinase
MSLTLSCPCCLRIGPGEGCFGIALDRIIRLNVIEVREDGEGGFVVKNGKYGGLEREIVQNIAGKVYQYFRKTHGISEKTVMIEIPGNSEYLRFLNQRNALAVLLIRCLSEVYGLKKDTDSLLAAFQANSNALECASSSILGKLSAVDRNQNTYLSFEWCDDWRFAIIHLESEFSRKEKLIPSIEEFHDSNAKSAVFITSVSVSDSDEEHARDLMYRSFQDKISYRENKHIIPFIEKLNIIGRTGRLAGMGFLKDDAGIILTGPEENIKKSLDKINRLYDRNAIKYRNHIFSVSDEGLTCTE